MTKGLVSSLMGIVIDESDGKLDWNTPVRDLLPGYSGETELLAHSALLADWMSMRSGTESYQPWFQSHNNIIFRKEDAPKIIKNLHQVRGIRSRFQYSNWGYEVAAQAIAKITGSSWDALMHFRIFEPLRLTRTDAKGELDHFENVAKAYTVLDNGTPIQIPRTGLSGKTILGAGGGVSSCISDLLVLYQNLLRAAVDQFETGHLSTEGSIFRQLNRTMSTSTPLPGPSFRESSYGLGWLRTELPNIMCKISPNLAQVGETPTLGKDAPSKLLIAHYGSMPGAYCGVNMFPETQTIIVVLTNTIPMCDMSDWTLQHLSQTVFDFPVKNDYVEWTKKTVDKELAWHESLVKELQAKPTCGTSPRDLESYVGEYENKIETFKVVITLRGDLLHMSLQGREDECFALTHYEFDTFYWLHTRNELVSRGRWVLQPASYYLLKFEAAQNADIVALSWQNDPELPEGERFLKNTMRRAKRKWSGGILQNDSTLIGRVPCKPYFGLHALKVPSA